ncbi:hypothetical protein GX441_11195 [bacterium]|nr:hypothetical protein [bacterium]
MELNAVQVEKPEDANVIIGMSHFIKTCEDFHEAMVETVPGIKFGLAFCEASTKRLIRVEGTDESLRELAAKNALAIGAGHSFVLMIQNAYPVSLLRRLNAVSETVNFFCATANPVQVIVAETEQGRGILGVIDGYPPLGVENKADLRERQSFLRKIGYKLF